jgi:hypothetical protein
LPPVGLMLFSVSDGDVAVGEGELEAGVVVAVVVTVDDGGCCWLLAPHPLAVATIAMSAAAPAARDRVRGPRVFMELLS